MPALAAIALGVVIGWISGGVLGGLARSSIRWGWFALLLFVVQAVARGRLMGLAGWSRVGVVVWIGCSIALVGIMLVEWSVPGSALGAAGVLLNVAVVLLNGGMPVGQIPAGPQFAQDGLTGAQRAFYHGAGQHTLGEVLGDIIPLGLFGSWTMVSLGDVLLMTGVVVWIVGSMTAAPAARETS